MPGECERFARVGWLLSTVYKLLNKKVVVFTFVHVGVTDELVCGQCRLVEQLVSQ